MKKKIEELSTEYYQVKYLLREISASQYEGQAFVVRNDSGGEENLYFCEYGTNIEDIENKIYQAICEKRHFLAEKPIDWNSKTKKIFEQLKVLENYKISFYVDLDESVKSGVFDKFMKDNYGSFLSFIIEQTKQLVIAIEQLSASERKSLLISDDTVYAKPTNAWNLDDLTLRSRIYSFFYNPSTEEVELHKAHIDKKRGTN